MLPYKSGTVRVTSPFGQRTLNGKKEQHKGIDLVGAHKDIVAVAAGRVLYSRMVSQNSGNRTWEWGNYICVQGEDGTLYYYCHLSSRSVQAGEKVTVGQIIGREGSTGYSTGSHLHFEVRSPDGVSRDPTPWLGIENHTGTHDAEKMYCSGMVCQRCGFEEETRIYLDRYRFSSDLWRKLWRAMDS